MEKKEKGCLFIETPCKVYEKLENWYVTAEFLFRMSWWEQWLERRV